MDLARQAERPRSSLEPASGTSRDVAGTATWSVAVARAVARSLLAAVPGAPLALVLPSGEEVGNGGSPIARLRIADMRTLLGLLGPGSDLHFGDAYADGRIVVEGDLLGLLEAVFAAPENGWLADLSARWCRLVGRGNSIRRSRANVHHHYDLGNDFYTLWLDREMVYTCAYFPTPAASLEEAQVAKMEHVARKLRLHPGENVIEAGCGWGALALHLARRHGVRVRAFNVSEEQVCWARERARREGLADRVEFIDDDYRNVRGTCDAFVSVGMLEHVGREHYGELAAVIDRTLAPHGRGLLHSIGRNRRREFSAFVQRRIFPGAYVPTLREMVSLLEPADFSVLDVENLRLHYARTLEHWLARFETHRDEVARRFSEPFVRIWRLYLAGSIAAFRTGALQLFQVVFTRGRSNAVPWTRADLYRP
jgi:cyclopropane-fatty-acyl-phospholipid synthase